MTSQTKTPVSLPALRAHMGNWIYYISFMTMGQIADRVNIVDHIHQSTSLRGLLQRALTNRSNSIKEYLINQPQRFFNALVVATYGGNPEWREISLNGGLGGNDTAKGNKPVLDQDAFDGTLGILSLTGSEKLFAVDGQHRVKGIIRAVGAKPSLGSEEVCVIFVKGVTQESRDEDPDGFERTRRLFTTLNRYAKPVSKRDAIALDEDDVVAIVTRRLVDEYPPFRDSISVKASQNIPVTDKVSFTTVVTLYDCMDIYLMRPRNWKDFKKLRPPDDEVESYYARCIEFWDLAQLHVERLSKYLAPGTNRANERGHHGGFLLARPVGLLATVRALKLHLDRSLSLDDAWSRIAKVPMDLASEPWVDLLWDSRSGNMLTAGENHRVAKYLMFYGSGGNLSSIKNYSEERLRTDLAAALKLDANKVRFSRYP